MFNPLFIVRLAALVIFLIGLNVLGENVPQSRPDRPRPEKLMTVYAWGSSVCDILSANQPLARIEQQLHPSIVKGISMDRLVSGIRNSASYQQLVKLRTSNKRLNLEQKAFKIEESQLLPKRANEPLTHDIYQVYVRWRTDDEKSAGRPGIESTIFVCVDKSTATCHALAFTGFGMGSDLLELSLLRSALEGGLLNH